MRLLQNMKTEKSYEVIASQITIYQNYPRSRSNLSPRKKGSRFCHRTKARIRTWYFEYYL